jgi:subtilisin family serine protease
VGLGTSPAWPADAPFRQPAYARVRLREPGQPPHAGTESVPRGSHPEAAGRCTPEVVSRSHWTAADLPTRAVPLPEGGPLGPWEEAEPWLGQVQQPDGGVLGFVPQVILIKFRGSRHVAAVRVEPMLELEALRQMAARPDVEFAELDRLESRQFTPDDPGFATQWHHGTLHSADAWEVGRGSADIRVAILDTPFQMDHPDLAANTLPGWSVITNAPINASAGIDHSTAGAGMVAAVLNNHLGVAGAGNCGVLPVHIAGFTDDMYNAIVWAADHGVRVVNVSWSGGDSATLNEAGRYLETQARGVLAMSGVNGVGFLDYTNQPHIYCISMTDAADNLQSRYGNHIDFAAPGFQVFTTLTAGGYGTVSGTSYATPLFCGVVAVLFSVNPTLSPAEAIDILRTTADDLGPAGWDPYFGWGRIHFGRAAAAALATLPRIVGVQRVGGQVAVAVTFRPGPDYTLWKSSRLAPDAWAPVADPPGRDQRHGVDPD